MANGQPRPAFYVAVFAVVLGLVGLAIWRYGGGSGAGTGIFSSDELKQVAGKAENLLEGVRLAAALFRIGWPGGGLTGGTAAYCSPGYCCWPGWGWVPGP